MMIQGNKSTATVIILCNVPFYFEDFLLLLLLLLLLLCCCCCCCVCVVLLQFVLSVSLNTVAAQTVSKWKLPVSYAWKIIAMKMELDAQVAISYATLTLIHISH
jgi:hypothetical protein